MRCLKVYLLPITILFFSGCLEEISNVPRQSSEATFLIVRNEGNSDEEINVYLDSLLIAKTFQDKISEVTVPAGEHTIFFEYSHDYYGKKIQILPNTIYATRQFVMKAYMFTRVAFDSLPEDSLKYYLKSTLPVVKYKYYEAKNKISSNRFNTIVEGFEDCQMDIRKYEPKKE